MITQRIRILKTVTTTVYFQVAGLFSEMLLNNLSTSPGFITTNYTAGYIGWLVINPTGLGSTDPMVYYMYYTKGGSPPTEDALLIIEIADSLTQPLDSCVKYQNILIGSITKTDGYARINLTKSIDKMPKVGEYVYIDSGIYSGYSMIKNVFVDTDLSIDRVWTANVSPTTARLTYFGANKTKCLVWINRQGGRSSSIFDTRVDYNEIIGESKQFDNNGSMKYFYRGKNFDYITVYKTGLTEAETDLIESLRYSIQVWEYDINTNVSTPILLDSSSFSKYNTKHRFNEITIKYRIAGYKEIQNQ